MPSDETGFPTGETGTVTVFTPPTEGTTGNDTLTGSAGSDVIFDTDGDIFSATGTDTIDAGDGDDTIRFGDGNDNIQGGAGDDRIGAFQTGSGTNTLDGGDGNDYIVGGSGNDTIYGGDGDDWLSGALGNDTIYAGSGDDEIWVTDDHQFIAIFGGENAGDADVMGFANWSSSQGVSVTYGGDDSGTFSFLGTATNGTFDEIEVIYGTDYADVVDATASTERIVLAMDDGDDVVDFGSGNDYIDAGSGNDTVDGGAGNDYLEGRDGADDLTGGAGDDHLVGGTGNDTLTGGTGNDIFHLTDGDGQDTITDFDLGDADSDGFTNDQLDVSALTDGGGSPVNIDDVVVTDDGSGNAVLTFPNGESVRLLGIAPAAVTQSQMVAMGVPCFAAGTRIRTPKGNAAIETLCAGDLVNTADNGPQPILWIARQKISGQCLRNRPKARPILIREGALGNTRNFMVSRQHALLMATPGRDEELFRAIQLARHNVPGIEVIKTLESVTYVHLLFEQHQIIFAENAMSESFCPGQFGLGSLSLLNRASLLSLKPELAQFDNTLAQYGSPARAFLKVREVMNLHERTMT